VDSESWNSAPVAVLEQIYALPKLRIRELDLYNALVRWCRAKRQDESEMRPHVDNVLRLVRFRCMNCFDFKVHCIGCSNLLTREEKYEIIQRSNVNFTNLFLPPGFAAHLHPRNLSEQSETFGWGDNNSVEGFVGAPCRIANLMSFQIKEGATCYLSGLSLSCQDFIAPGQRLRLQVSVYGNIHCDVLLYTTAAYVREKSSVGGATVPLRHPVPLHSRHFYAIKIEYFTEAAVRCKVYLMTPLNLGKEQDGVFFKLVRNDVMINDICSLELRREIAAD
jgi:hypothetical protein